MTGPILQTERLTLRPTAMEDFLRWAELLADTETARFIGGVQESAATWRSVMTMAGTWSLTGVACRM